MTVNLTRVFNVKCGFEHEINSGSDYPYCTVKLVSSFGKSHDQLLTDILIFDIIY